MAMISRDPFARSELHRETVAVVSAACNWCGGVRRSRAGRFSLFQYYVEPDGIRPRRNDVDGLFCSIGCMRSYHG